MCRLHTLSPLPLEAVVRWLLCRGMLQLQPIDVDHDHDHDLQSIAYGLPLAASGGGGGDGADDDDGVDGALARKLERWWTATATAGSRPSNLRALLAALVQQVLPVRVEVRPEDVVARLVEDGWLSLQADDGDCAVVYSIPPATDGGRDGAAAASGDDVRLRERLEEWLATMCERELKTRDVGGPPRLWMSFESALGSFEAACTSAVDRRQLVSFLLGVRASSLH
jgi:hypothetical protein